MANQQTARPSTTLMTRDAFLEAARVGKAPAEVILRKQVAGSFEKAGDAAPAADSRVRSFCISTQAVDRDNDTVAVAGWQIDNYRKNPVVLWAHDYSALPIGKCTDLSVKDGKLMAKAEFANHPMADTVLSLVDGGFLNATSVGFRPIDYSMNQDRQGMDFTKQELLEFSVVPVPANPQALVAASAAGIDIAPVKAWADQVIAAFEAKDADVDEATDDRVEMIGYNELASQIAALRDLVGRAGDVVTSLIAAEQDGPDGTPNPDDQDDIEDARLNVLSSLTSQAYGVLSAIDMLCWRLCADDDDDDDGKVIIQLSGETKAVKTGRALSQANETRIRAAHAHLEAVLAAAAPKPKPDDQQPAPADDGDGDADAGSGDDGKTKLGGQSVPCPECGQPMNAPAGAGCQHPRAHEVVVGKSDDEDVLAGLGDGDELAALTIDDMREAMTAALGPQAVAKLVQDEIQSALARARGRVD